MGGHVSSIVIWCCVGGCRCCCQRQQHLQPPTQHQNILFEGGMVQNLGRRGRDPCMAEEGPVVLFADAQVHVGFRLLHPLHLVELFGEKFQQMVVITADNLC